MSVRCHNNNDNNDNDDNNYNNDNNNNNDNNYDNDNNNNNDFLRANISNVDKNKGLCNRFILWQCATRQRLDVDARNPRKTGSNKEIGLLMPAERHYISF